MTVLSPFSVLANLNGALRMWNGFHKIVKYTLSFAVQMQICA